MDFGNNNPFNFNPAWFAGKDGAQQLNLPAPPAMTGGGSGSTQPFPGGPLTLNLNNRGVPASQTPSGLDMSSFVNAINPMFAATNSLPTYHAGTPFNAAGASYFDTQSKANPTAFPGWAHQTAPLPPQAPSQDQINQLVNDAIARQVAQYRAAAQPTQAQLDQQFINQQNWGIGGANNVGGQGA